MGVYWGIHLTNPRQPSTKIWCADNYGQLSRNGTNSKHIGKWDMGNILGKVNSINLSKSYENDEWDGRNAFHKPRNNKENLATRYSNDAAILKQLDYILIEQIQKLGEGNYKRYAFQYGFPHASSRNYSWGGNCAKRWFFYGPQSCILLILPESGKNPPGNSTDGNRNPLHWMIPASEIRGGQRVKKL